MTCKDCIFYELLCRDTLQENELELCNHFKNKDDFVEVKHGEWLFDFTLDGLNFYRCSVCGRQECLLAKESTEEYFPYCHCGAKMEGERK